MKTGSSDHMTNAYLLTMRRSGDSHPEAISELSATLRLRRRRCISGCDPKATLEPYRGGRPTLAVARSLERKWRRRKSASLSYRGACTHVDRRSIASDRRRRIGRAGSAATEALERPRRTLDAAATTVVMSSVVMSREEAKITCARRIFGLRHAPPPFICERGRRIIAIAAATVCPANIKLLLVSP